MTTIATAIEHTLARLRGDADLMTAVGRRVYEGVAPEGAQYPLVLVQVYADANTTVYNGGTIAMSSVEMSVRAVGAGDDVAPLIPLARRIRIALHDTAGTYTDGTVVSCHQVTEQSQAEVRAGRTWRYLGARFRLLVS